MKKISSLVLGLAVLICTTLNLNAAESKETKIVENKTITDVNECTDIVDEYEKNNFEKREIINIIDPNLANETPDRFVLANETPDHSVGDIQTTMFWDKWEIRNFKKDNYNIVYPDSPLRVSYYGPGTGKMSINQSVSVGFTASTGISWNMVEAKVGFSLKGSYGVTDTQEIRVPAGKKGKITAYTLYAQWRMDVYKNGKYVGQEFVHKPIGVSFHVDIFNK
ncbi:hypothetical protein CYJ41_08030 [Campylobacter ureolyticus]|uniref:Uncharacterized protein n=1 Tax=Campylobacter ureolyticus TaxID=827 RepID=A0A2I1N8D8_9BACT|nr:hypothetical protein [Campylobacter ureolyticus]PKZ28640.1 hypothetical protein CYJ41_08030 [Campylobacter ureolyticus]